MNHLAIRNRSNVVNRQVKGVKNDMTRFIDRLIEEFEPQFLKSACPD